MTDTAHDRVLRVLAGAGPAGVAPGEMPHLTVLDDRASRRAVHRLIERGQARRDGPRGRIYATAAAGIAAREGGPAVTDSGPGMPAPDNGVRLADLDQALAPLPAPHRALTRLLVCTVIARRHLRQARPSGWLAGIAAGPTGTGKTLIGSVVCQVTGTDPAAAVRPRVTSPTWPCQRPRRATALSPSPQRPSTCSRRTWPSSRPPRQRSRTGQALDLERCVGARRA